MRWDDVSVHSGAAFLGLFRSVDEAVEDGRYDPEYRKAHNYESVAIASDTTTEDLAGSAARACLERTSMTRDRIGLVTYSTVSDPTPDILTPATIVQGVVLPGPRRTLEVSQGCNSAVAAIELSAGMLASGLAAEAALVLTVDKHDDEDLRFTCDVGALPGDGGTALLLARGDGPVCLLSTACDGDGSLTPPAIAPRVEGVDRKAQMLEHRAQLIPILKARRALQQRVVAQALMDAEITPEQVSTWVLPNVGEFLADRALLEHFDVPAESTTWDWGRRVGHMDCGDQIAGLVHLMESDAVDPGDHVVVIGASVSGAYGAAVFRVDASAPERFGVTQGETGPGS